MLTEQCPERPHRSGGIQKRKVPVTLENQSLYRNIYIYIYLYIWLQLGFRSLELLLQ